MEKNKENMNPESIKTLKEFHKKRINNNIKLHKIFLSMIILINIILIIFIIAYKTKIHDIQIKSQGNASVLKEKTNYKTSINDSILHKLVNIFTISMNVIGNYHFSMVFETSEEVNMVKSFISSSTDIKSPSLLLIYQDVADSDNSQKILESIDCNFNILIIMETKNGEKFGFFFDKQIAPNKDGYYKLKSDKCFLFSFKNKKKYDCIGKEINFEINKEILFDIGRGDIEIYHNFDENGGKINFPFKSFDVSNENDFKNGYFSIKGLEIYLIFNRQI